MWTSDDCRCEEMTAVMMTDVQLMNLAVKERLVMIGEELNCVRGIIRDVS